MNEDDVKIYTPVQGNTAGTENETEEVKLFIPQNRQNGNGA